MDIDDWNLEFRVWESGLQSEWRDFGDHVIRLNAKYSRQIRRGMPILSPLHMLAHETHGPQHANGHSYSSNRKVVHANFKCCDKGVPTSG